jgi:hypothetical protein
VTCLTAAQVEAARKIYSPVINSPGGQISPGDSPGAEAVPSNWGAWITGPKAGAPAFGSLITNAFFSGIVFENPKWDFQTLNFSSDDKLAAIFNSTNPNLRPFKAHGGKLIQYHGWGAPHISRIFCAMHHKLTFLPISCLR